MSAEELHLGVAEVLPRDELYKLRATYFPLGKIGGRPSWLNPVQVPTAGDLKCEVCEKSMSFVIQLYAVSPNDPAQAFHRYLYVFVCRNGECSQQNKSGNVKVLRQQLPRKSPYHGESPLDPHIEVEDRKEFDGGEKSSKLCNTCGVRAGSKCGKCSTWYCSKDHQVIDWRAGHKEQCGKSAEAKLENNMEDECNATKYSVFAAPPPNPFLFKEFGLKIIKDYVPKVDLAPIPDNKSDPAAGDDEDSDESDEDDEESEDFKREQQDQYEQLMEKLKQDGLDDPSANGLADTVHNEQRDRYFKRFSRLVQRCPDQVLRYARNKQPLRPSDHSNMDSPVPKCESCGAERTFEFQLMPHLLSLMEVDTLETSVDWATVCVYTCSKACSTARNGFLFEHAVKHDFIETRTQPEGED
ncbi:VMA21-like domain protein [Aphelenchoides bicaudatus]|nr:VMA21-like domain protein [Aphelenchoides bicaudatus]